MAAQFIATNGAARRELREWMALATSSLPVPDSPVIKHGRLGVGHLPHNMEYLLHFTGNRR